MMNCLGCGDARSSTSSAVHSFPQAISNLFGISLDSLLSFIRNAPSSSSITARQLIHEVVIPQTHSSRSSYANTLPSACLGPSLYYLAFSWDAPFHLALQSILQHLSLPTQLWESLSDDQSHGMHSSDSSMVASVPPAMQRILESTFVFVDFLSINMWTETPDDVLGTLDMGARKRESFESRDTGSPVSRRVPKRILTSGSLGERSIIAHAGNAFFGSKGSRGGVRASMTQTDLAATEDQLFSYKLDPEHFVQLVGSMLSSSNTSIRAVLLCLDPELAVLGQLIPMHAAWRAMRSQVPVYMAPGRELCWPKHLQRPGIVFRLDMADEDDAKLREALLKDLNDYVKVRLNACLALNHVCFKVSGLNSY